MARLMLTDPAMMPALNFADVAIRAEGDHWVVVDHADRPVLDQRFPDRIAAITLGLLVARHQGGAVWLEQFDASTETPSHRPTCH